MVRGMSKQPTPRPALMQLADARLGKPVEVWIAEQRAGGLSWQAIAIELFKSADLPVAPSTLLRWASWSDDNGGSSSGARRRSA
jgi:hypothetical protein